MRHTSESTAIHNTLQISGALALTDVDVDINSDFPIYFMTETIIPWFNPFPYMCRFYFTI